MRRIKKAKKLFWKIISELVKAHDWDRMAAARVWFNGELKEKSRDIFHMPGWLQLPID